MGVTKTTAFRAASLLLGISALALATLARADGGPSQWRTGDADCSGRVDAVDASLALQWDARLVLSLPCFDAADANNDLAVDSLDAVLILQQEAALIDRLGVVETRLCPAAAGKGRYGDLEVEIDLDGDGTPEVVAIHLDRASSQAAFSLSAYDAGGQLHLVTQLVAPTLFLSDPNGPDTWWAPTDLTGDGKDEAVFCVTAFGANDPFTDAVIFSYHSGSPSIIFSQEQVPWALLTREGDSLVTSKRLDWSAGTCEAITTDYYAWDGTTLAVTHENVTKRFRRDDCAGLWTSGR